MWMSLVSRHRRFKQTKSGLEAVHNPLMDKLSFLDSTLIPQESTQYSNFDSLSDRDLETVATGSASGSQQSIPVLGDRTNSVSSSLSAIKRKRRLLGEESSAVMTAAEAVIDRVDRIHSEDRYTYIGNFVTASLRRMSDAEADRMIHQIVSLLLHIGHNAEHDYERPQTSGFP